MAWIGSCDITFEKQGWKTMICWIVLPRLSQTFLPWSGELCLETEKWTEGNNRNHRTLLLTEQNPSWPEEFRTAIRSLRKSTRMWSIRLDVIVWHPIEHHCCSHRCWSLSSFQRHVRLLDRSVLKRMPTTRGVIMEQTESDLRRSSSLGRNKWRIFHHRIGKRTRRRRQTCFFSLSLFT